MSRIRRKDLDLPPHVYRKGRGFYYGRAGIALGFDKVEMLRRYAEVHGTAIGAAHRQTFSDAAALYRKDTVDGLPSKAAKTQGEYERQLRNLEKIFGSMALEEIEPKDINDMMKAMGRTVSATRTKALFSAVFNFARAEGLTQAPNPCAGIRGKKAGRDIDVTDEMYLPVWEKADPIVRDYLDLLYLTGADASVALRLTAGDVHTGSLAVQRTKTKRKTQVELVGALEALLTRLTAGAAPVRLLIRDEKGQPFTLGGIRKRFYKARLAAGQTWQLRDLRAAAATAVGATEARKLLSHAQATTTDHYLRMKKGERARGPQQRPIDRVKEEN
jgi:integrase